VRMHEMKETTQSKKAPGRQADAADLRRRLLEHGPQIDGIGVALADQPPRGIGRSRDFPLLTSSFNSFPTLK
jgi:hypothetical protein